MSIIAMPSVQLTLRQDMERFNLLNFKNRASYIKDGRTANLQMLHYIYIFFNKYKYRVF